MKYLTIALIAILSLQACTSAEVKPEATATAPGINLDSAKAAIAASNTLFGSSWATNDSAAFVARYSSDACINPPNAPQMCGSTAIGAFFRGGYTMGIRKIQLTTKEVSAADPYVIETGEFQVEADKGMVLDNGKFIVIWKQENGQWKMFKDIWNSNNPMPAPAK